MFLIQNPIKKRKKKEDEDWLATYRKNNFRAFKKL